MGRFLFTVCLCWLLAAGAAAEQVVLTLTVGGDCVLGTREEWQQEEGTFLTVVAERGADWPFRNLREIFLEDDMTLLNLECVLQADNQGHDYGKQHTFRGDPAYAEMLPRAGVEQVNVANNHFIDYRARPPPWRRWKRRRWRTAALGTCTSGRRKACALALGAAGKPYGRRARRPCARTSAPCKRRSAM